MRIYSEKINDSNWVRWFYSH